MENILVAIFDSEAQARDASHALDELNDTSVIRVNAGAIVTKSSTDALTVTRTHRPALEGTLGATALGTFIGLLSGGPVLAIGAIAGLAFGAAEDVFTIKVERDFLADVERTLAPGKSAVVSQIYEESTGPVDARMASLGGTVFRRALRDVADEGYEKQVTAVKRRLSGGHHV